MTQFGFEETTPAPPQEGNYKEKFSVVVDCTGEAMQKEVWELLQENGYEARIVSV
jgi:hypothetical protein